MAKAPVLTSGPVRLIPFASQHLTEDYVGWLNDPVLSSIVMRDKSRIAEIIFHELAHERLYVPGDTTFNESFAMSVANAGLARWLPLHGSDFTEVERARLREEQFVRLGCRR